VLCERHRGGIDISWRVSTEETEKISCLYFPDWLGCIKTQRSKRNSLFHHVLRSSSWSKRRNFSKLLLGYLFREPKQIHLIAFACVYISRFLYTGYLPHPSESVFIPSLSYMHFNTICFLNLEWRMFYSESGNTDIFHAWQVMVGPILIAYYGAYSSGANILNLQPFEVGIET
jgi:hypothetical protein